MGPMRRGPTVYQICAKKLFFIMIVFLKITLISKKFKVTTPDWTQIKYDLKMFISETNLAPVIKLFENQRQNIEKQC